MSKQADIWHEVIVKAPPAKAYAALTEVNQLAGWWTGDTRGESRLGGKLDFRFGKFRQVMEVTALKPGALVRWRAQKPGVEDWVGSDIEFRLFPQEQKTRVLFHHSRWQADAGMRAHCSMSWATYLMSFKQLVEMGEGWPNHLPAMV